MFQYGVGMESFFSYDKLMLGGLEVKSTLQERQTVGNNPP